MQHDRAPVDPHENLFVVGRKRFVPVYNPGPDGTRELSLYCGAQEITFDEPDLFPWAETLIQQESFLAGSAITWSPEPLEWPRVQELLGSLIEAGILARSPPPTIAQVPLSAAHLAFLKAEETRAAPAEPRFWNPNTPAVMRDIAGRDLELGYIEAVVPVHRIAHIALDREGRHVGEMNAFPDALRLKIPTDWKPCGYAGTRHRDDMPMNMTALRSMLAHWKPILRAALAVREEFLSRYPQLPSGRWKAGDLHFLSSAVLALPTLLLMRGVDPVANGDLDPVLSSLFRVVDGVRMVTAHMLDLPEAPVEHDTQVGIRDITDAAERFDLYRSIRGVCAGPQTMIDELLATLMNGKPLEADVPLGPWASDIPRAVDYALHGRLVYCAVFTLWVRMGLAYTQIHDAVLRAPARGRLGRLRAAMERDWHFLLPSRHHDAAQREWSERLYRTMFEEAQRGIRGRSERLDLRDLLTPPSELLGGSAPGALREVFVAAEEDFAAPSNGPVLEEIAGYVLDYLRFERTTLRAVTSLQRDIDVLLERAHPEKPLKGSQLAIYHVLRKGLDSALPYLLDTVEETLGISIDNEPALTTVTHGGRSLVLR